MIFINAHEIVLDKEERLKSWTSYDRIVHLAMDFIHHCPINERNGLPWYLQYSCFWTDPLRPTEWPDNPAGKFAWATTTLCKYYPYSGQTWMIEIVRKMLDRLWDLRCPDDFAWGGLPYASAHPGTGIYFGARADGEFVTEPDKTAQAGRACLDFYRITGEKRFLEMAESIAHTLAGKIRKGDETHSPLPFRVNVKNGQVVEEYTAHMLPVVRLFEDLSELGFPRYSPLQQQVWQWIEDYPLKNQIWKGHFEDIRLDPENQNRDQLSALETARYILEKKDRFLHWRETTQKILDWVEVTFAAPPFFHALPIHEQKYCFFVMGSHTARFASVCAMLGELTTSKTLQQKAELSLNWAGYMANENGTVTVGVDRPDYDNQCWFTDGYFDYVPHFIDGMAALPHTAPQDRNCMLRSTSIIQDVEYKKNSITYRAFDDKGVQRLKLTNIPKEIRGDGKPLPLIATINKKAGWKEYGEGSRVIDIQAHAREVEITL